MVQEQFALTANDAAPGVDCFAISKSDTVNFTQGIARAIYVGAAGDVAIVTPVGSVVTWVACPIGFIIPCAAIRVNSANTSASSLVGIL
jgi:hypothetical protein